MNYRDFNDYELLDQVYSCNEDANEIIIYKYRPLIVNLATQYIKLCHGGVDLNDLIQEGMLGLNDAINTFREDKETNFGTYARLCIKRKIISLVKSTRTQKNMILNDSIPIEIDDEHSFDKFLMDNRLDPSSVIIESTHEQELINKLNQQLTDFEKQVFELKLEGFSYKEISDILDKDTKSIDNAIQRIKNKLKKILTDN